MNEYNIIQSVIEDLAHIDTVRLYKNGYRISWSTPSFPVYTTHNIWTLHLANNKKWIN